MRRRPKRQAKLQDLLPFLKQHKIFFTIGTLVILTTGIIATYSAMRQTEELSYTDFTKLSEKIDSVYASIPVKDRTSTRTCYYERPNFGQSLLYCSVETVGYVPMETLGQEATAEDFANKLPLLGVIPEKNLQDFLSKAQGTYATMTIDTGIKGSTCTASLEQGSTHQLVSFNLPIRDSTGEVSIYVNCSGKAQQTYFSMK